MSRSVEALEGPAPLLDLIVQDKDGKIKTRFMPGEQVHCRGDLFERDGVTGIVGAQVVVGLINDAGEWVMGLADDTVWPSGHYHTYFVASDIPSSYWSAARLVATWVGDAYHGEAWSNVKSIKIEPIDGEDGFPWLPVVVIGGVAVAAAITLLTSKHKGVPKRSGVLVV